MDRGHAILPEGGYGFFSNYFRILSFLVEIDKRGLEPWVDWRNTAFVEGYNPFEDKRPPINPDNPWDWWFEQTPLGNKDRLIKIECDCGTLNHEIRFWKREGMEPYKFVNNKYAKIRKHLLDRVDMIFNTEFKNNVVLGVMARGCEMNKGHPERGNQTIETWTDKTKEVLNKYQNINKIFVVTEDSHYLPIFDNMFDNIFYLDNVFRRTDETLEYMLNYPLWPCIDTKRPNQCRLLGEETIIQALLLSKCDYLIVKQCGVSSGAIFWAGDNLKNVFYTMPYDKVE